jgi:16S rRNA (uracil1498-N3)-methyltransferase
VAIAPTKNIERLEWMVEKCTEIGVDEITPLLCRFSERKNLRNDRLEKIILSAAKQSLTPYLPKLNPLTDFATLMQMYGDKAMKREELDKYIAHCYKDEKRELKDALRKGKDVLILIGPEGDFSEPEVEQAIQEGFVPVGLGRSRLRTETAGVVACHTAVLLNED